MTSSSTSDATRAIEARAPANLNIKIPPLDGHADYEDWSLQVQDTLKEWGLWGYVSGSVKRPAEEGADADEWDNTDQRIMAAVRR